MLSVYLFVLFCAFHGFFFWAGELYGMQVICPFFVSILGGCSSGVMTT